MLSQHPIVCTNRDCGGMTLLEVLIACGILLVGLSGIAALLPAASLQFSRAATEDRAGILAANANSDVRSRRLSASALCSTPALAVAFGPGFTELASVAPAWFANPVAGSLAQWIDSSRGFWLEDDLTYQLNSAGYPSNTFGNGKTGPRGFKERVCWAGLILPGMKPDGTGAAEASAGQPATLAIATFRKAPAVGSAVKRLTLSAPYKRPQQGQPPPPGVCFTVSPQDLNGEADRKQFLNPCGWILLLPKLSNPATPQTPPAPIRLLQINSSWTLPNGGSSQLVLRIPDDLLAVDGDGKLLIDRYRTLTPLDELNGTQTLNVVGIANVVRLDQHHLTLD
jgi:hypothetical protein